MTNDEIKQLWRRANSHAIRRGHSGLADDFSQEAVLAWIGGRKATVEQLLIDFLRKEYGSARVRSSRKHPSNSPGGSKFNSLDQAIGDSDRTRHDITAAPERDPGAIGDTRKFGVSLDGKAAVVCELAGQGYLQNEVGEILGFTEYRTSQLMKVVRRKIKEEQLIREKYDEYKDFKETSVLVIDWIAI